MTNHTPPPLPDANSAVRTYLRAVASLIPAILVWIFANSFILPKLNQVWELAGLTGSKAQVVMDTSYALQKHFSFVFAGGVIVCLVLEVRWAAWPRHRRIVVACVALFLNTAVLVGITATATAALLVVPRLTNTK